PGWIRQDDRPASFPPRYSPCCCRKLRRSLLSSVVVLPRLKCPAGSDSGQQFVLCLVRFPGRLFSEVHSDTTAVDSLLQLGGAVLQHNGRPLDLTFADIAKPGRSREADWPLCIVGALAPFQVDHAGGHHGALGGTKVTAGKVLAQDESCRVLAGEGHVDWINAGSAAGKGAVAAFEDHAVVERDGVEQAVLGNVGDEAVELSALQEREDIRQGVKLAAHEAPLSCQASSQRGCSQMPSGRPGQS